MAKKRSEPFNPWPGFVDLFASVIMVVLMFMLVLIVNITYYAQFKYKISYTGTVAIEEEVINPIDMPKAKPKKYPDINETREQKEPSIKEEIKKEFIPVAGVDLSVTDINKTRQDNVMYNEWMVIKYLDSEVILDPGSVKDIEEFLSKNKDTFFEHSVSVYIREPQNQISASVAKQLALSRVLNIRNLLRKKGYKNEDIMIRLRDAIPQEKSLEHVAGYAIIVIEPKRR